MGHRRPVAFFFGIIGAALLTVAAGRRCKELYHISRVSQYYDDGERHPEAHIPDFNFSAVTDLLNTAPNARFITVQLPRLNGVMARNGSIDYAERVAPGVTRLFGHLDASVEATDPNATPTFSLYVNHRSKTVQGHIRGKKAFYGFDGTQATMLSEMSLDAGVCVLPSAAPRHYRRELGADGEEGGGHHHHHHHHHHHDEEDHGYDQPLHNHPDIFRRLQQAVPPSRTFTEADVKRSLAAGPGPRPFLIYINMGITAGSNAQWGAISNVVLCPAAFRAADSVAALVAEVREDFAPFDVTVTADRAVYDAWTDNRVMVGVIESVSLNGRVIECGIAYVSTYTQVDNLVWAGCNCGGDITTAATISHEVGHTFGLLHDGDKTRLQGSQTYEYLYDLPKYDVEPNWPLSRRWNTIMGGSIEAGISQWNGGNASYSDSTNSDQDDVAVLRSTIGTRSGMPCNQTFNLRDASNGAVIAYPENAISCAGGMDTYYVRMNRGAFSIQISSSAETNMKFRATITMVTQSGSSYADSGAAIARGENDAYLSTPVVLAGITTQPTAIYAIRVMSIEQTTSSASAGYKFPIYGSMGFYSVTVTPPAPTGPTPAPTRAPTRAPTPAPTPGPTVKPTPAPTPAPTLAPTPAATAVQSSGVTCNSWPGSGVQTLFSSTDKPASTNLFDNIPLNLGMRFRTTAAGDIRAVRFYKANSEGGSGHVARIYNWATGALLASSDGSLLDTTCTGPQWVVLPLTKTLRTAINTEYVVAIDSVRYYAKTGGYFTSGAKTSGIISATASVFSLNLGSMPKETSQAASNYWIDLEVTPLAASPTPSTPPPTPAPTPSPTSAASSAYVCDVWPSSGRQTIFFPSDTPQALDLNDGVHLVLGQRFTTAVAGDLLAVRYYKAASEGGSSSLGGRTGRIYDWSSGALLASTELTVDDGCPGPRWVSIPLQASLRTAVGKEYVVAIDGVDYYTKTDVYDLSANLGGSINPTIGGAVYGFDTGVMPNGAGGDANYWVDVEMSVPASTATSSSCNTWPHTGWQTFLTSSAGPDDLDLTDGRPLVLGQRFTTDAVGDVRAVRFYKAMGEDSDAHTARIYDWSTGRVLATSGAMADTICGVGWVSVPLRSPLRIAPGTEYVAVIDSLSHYVKTSYFPFASTTTEDLTMTDNGGVYGFLSAVMPDDSAVDEPYYWIDVEFHPPATASSTTRKLQKKQFLQRKRQIERVHHGEEEAL